MLKSSLSFDLHPGILRCELHLASSPLTPCKRLANESNLSEPPASAFPAGQPFGQELAGQHRCENSCLFHTHTDTNASTLSTCGTRSPPNSGVIGACKPLGQSLT